EESAVLAAEVFERRRAALDHDPGVAPRDGRRFEPSDAFVHPTQEVLAFPERDLAVVQEEAKAHGRRSGGFRVRDLLRVSGEGVAEAVDGPDEAGLARAVAERVAELVDHARQVRLRDMRARPEPVADLRLGHRAGPAPQQQLEQLERLRTDG